MVWLVDPEGIHPTTLLGFVLGFVDHYVDYLSYGGKVAWEDLEWSAVKIVCPD